MFCSLDSQIKLHFVINVWAIYFMSYFILYIRGETEVGVEISLSGDDKLVGMGEVTGTAVVKSPIRKIKSGQEAEEAAAYSLPTR